MLDRLTVYDIVYALAASDGREAVLFGNCARMAHEAFARSRAGHGFPEVWFELPLAGDPWFDLHVSTLHEQLQPGAAFTPDNTGGHPELFEWFASARDVKQLSLSYDLHANDIDHPAVHLLVAKTSMHVPFLELAGGQGAAAAYRSFEQRLPDGWFACYTGIFPGRSDALVRVECIPHTSLQRAYANDGALLESHLRQVGFSDIGDTIAPRCRAITDRHFSYEFQFDVRYDGTLGDTLGLSVRLAAPNEFDDGTSFGRHGAAAHLMERIESWGLADDRWHLLPDTMFVKRITHEGQSAKASFYPGFVKLRWRAGEPLDAKTYLLAVIH